MEKGQVLKVLSYVLLIIAAFLSINFSKDLGLIYAILITSIGFSVLIDKNIEFPLYREGGWISSFLWGIGGYVILTISSTIILQGIFAAQGAGFIQVLSSSLPAFANLPIFTVFSYAFFIGTIETVAFCRVWELIANFGKSDFKVGNGMAWLSLIITLSIFAIFHATAKNLNWIALLIVGLMMGISILLTWKTKDMRAAVILHIIANFIAILFTFNLLPNALMSMLGG